MSRIAMNMPMHMAAKPIQIFTGSDMDFPEMRLGSGGRRKRCDRLCPYCKNARIHDPAPEGRDERKQNAAGIAERQFGRPAHGRELGERSRRLSMMIAVPAHVEDQEIGKRVGGIPTV